MWRLSTNWWDSWSHSENSVLATHKTIENSWISRCLLPKQRGLLFTDAWQCFWQDRVSDRQGMEWRVEVWLTMKIRRLKRLCSALPWRSCFFVFMTCFGSRQFLRGLWMDITGGNYSKNDSFAWRKGDHPHDLYVAKVSLFRKYSWSCSHSNPNCLADCLTKASAKADNPITAVQTGKMLDVDNHRDLRTLMEHKAFLSTWCRIFMHTREKEVFFLSTLKISLAQPLQEGPFQVMFTGTQHTKEHPISLVSEADSDKNVVSVFGYHETFCLVLRSLLLALWPWRYQYHTVSWSRTDSLFLRIRCWWKKRTCRNLWSQIWQDARKSSQRITRAICWATLCWSRASCIRCGRQRGNWWPGLVFQD